MPGSEAATHQVNPYGGWLHVATDPAQWRKLRRVVKRLPKGPDALGLSSLVVEVTPLDRHIPHLAVYVDVAGHGGAMAELVDTIAHESTHAAGQLLQHVGQDHCGTDEHYAYLVGWIARKVWESCADAFAQASGDGVRLPSA